MANARIAQSTVQLVANSSPNVRVAQSVLQIILIGVPAPASTPMQILPGGGCAGEGCGPERKASSAVSVPIRRAVDLSWVQAVYFRRH